MLIFSSALYRKIAFHGPHLCYSTYLLTTEFYVKTFLAGQEALVFPAAQLEYFAMLCVRTQEQQIVMHAKHICLSSSLRDFFLSSYL